MIKPGEIQQRAREIGVRDQQIEKDYILSWILRGIAQHKLLSDFHEKLKERLPGYKGQWKSSIHEQIHDLPDFDKVEREILRELKRLKP